MQLKYTDMQFEPTLVALLTLVILPQILYNSSFFHSFQMAIHFLWVHLQHYFHLPTAPWRDENANSYMLFMAFGHCFLLLAVFFVLFVEEMYAE